jgi:hypothetical protein
VSQEYAALGLSPEQSPKPRLKFLFWEHIKKNASRVAEEVRDCDVIAMELAGVTPEWRQQLGQAATTFVSSTASASERRKAGKFLKQNSDVFRAGPAVLSKLKGSDKRIVYIDMDSEDSRGTSTLHNDLLEDSNLATERFKRLVKNSKKPSPDDRRSFTDMVAANARSDAAREELLVSQIDHLVQSDVGTDERIGILLGAAHTPVFHKLSRRIASERKFIGVAKDGQKAAYNPTDALVRRVSLRPDVPMTEKEIDNAIRYEIQRLPSKMDIASVMGRMLLSQITGGIYDYRSRDLRTRGDTHRTE